MRRTETLLLFLALPAVVTGCESCLNLDDYTLVPNDGGPGGSTSGAGGSPPATCAPGVTEGAVFASAIVEAGSESNDSPACDLPSSTGPGLDVVALAPVDGSCIARTRIVASGGAVIDSAPHVRHSTEGSVYVAGTFHGGAITFPLQCSTSATVSLEESSGATASMFVAALRFEGSVFCTEWARQAWTTDPGAAGALRIHGLDGAEGGSVAIAGTLGGAAVTFDDGAAGIVRVGGAFFARYGADGAIGEAAALEAPAGAPDVAMDVRALGSAWLVTGALRDADPNCHDCPGATNVLDVAGSCPVSSTGGAGGVGGAAGAAGAGGVAGAGGGPAGAGGTAGAGAGAAGGAAPDSENAFLWMRPSVGDSCTRLETFGSDRLADADSQIGHGVSVASTSSECRAFWTGHAGRDPWRLDVDGPTTGLFDNGGASRDGFLARFAGAGGLACAYGEGPAWSIRLSPSDPSAIVWGDRAAAAVCSDSVVTTTFVRGATGGTVDLHLCPTQGDACTTSSEPLPASAGDALLASWFDKDGRLVWSGAFGPIASDDDAGVGTWAGRSHDDLALDHRDYAYLVFRTTGPLQLANVELFSCEDVLADGAPAGTYVVALSQAGAGQEAFCEWAVRLGQ